MYLKSLLLHGFKSFADKTVLDFSTGVTGIVGPNGCGKSNVVDAIRWVLGETSAKALRGSEMADVIFNGTDKRKPVGMAEVTLTMAECEGILAVDYNEVSITRKVFRDGKSEYRLNGTVCRLKDIQELFAGTGIGRTAYSIMAQGQIDMLLSSKPEDRRSVFEEAAGITKFKGQKREALRKVEYTEANLLRLNDIIAEVKRQMGSVQRQAQKAKRYQLLMGDMRCMDTHLGHKQFVSLSEEKNTTQDLLRDLLVQMNDMHKEQHGLEQSVAEAKEQYQAAESTINSLRTHSQELRAQLQAAEGRIGFNRERAEELQSRIQRHEEDIENNSHLIDQATAEMASADEQVLAIQMNIEGRQLALSEHQGGHIDLVPARTELEHERRRVREMLRMSEGQIAAAESKQQTLTTQVASDRQRHELLSKEAATAVGARETAQMEFDEIQRQLQEHEAQRHEYEEQLKLAAATLLEKRKQRDALDNEVNEVQRQLTQKRSRLEAIQHLISSGEGLEQGTQAVLRGMDQPEVYLTGVRGLLASSIEVEPAFITPVEAALRESLQAVLLTESEFAEQILQRLADQKGGRAAIIPADFLAAQGHQSSEFPPAGCIAWAATKVKAKEGAAQIVDHLLGRVAIVEDLHTAMRVKREHRHLAVVTLRGEFISLDGIVYGGATKEAAASTLRREAELRELQQQADALATLLNEKEELVLERSIEIEDLQREEAATREASQRVREGLSQLTGRISIVQRTLQQAVSRAETVEWEQGQLGTRIAEAEAQMVRLTEQATLAMEQLETARERDLELQTEADALARREFESQERLTELRNALMMEQAALSSIERQKAPMATRLTELQASVQRYHAEMLTWRERIAGAEAENRRLTEEIETHRMRLAEVEEQGATLLDTRLTAQETMRGLDAQLNALRSRSADMTEQRAKGEVTLTRADLRLETLTNQLRERYQLDLAEFTPDYAALLESLEQQRKVRARGEKRKASGEGTEDEDLDLPKKRQRKAAQKKEEAITSIEGAVVISTEADDEGEVVSMAEDESEEVFNIAEATDIEGNALEETEPEIVAAVEEPEIEVTEEHWEFIAEIVGELRQRLENIGPVNLDAIQEFEELEQRFTFLETQHSDLTKSKQELLEVIAKINETTKQMFSSTFAEVRTHFQNNFRELFGAQAKADLVLVDEADPLESGIEIIAKPPGKKLQTISLLSGGERSMTAVALLFSIYQVKPSPFCVLDELDAPLDESNISRFLSMLDKFVTNSQFIVVTHNKRTMNRADVIYGVTMQEFGVSKPVGVRMTTEATSLAAQRGIGRVAVDDEGAHHVDLLPAGTRSTPKPKKSKRQAEDSQDEFAALNVDSEQAAAAAQRPTHDLTEPEDVLATLAAEDEGDVVFSLDAEEEEVGLSA